MRVRAVLLTLVVPLSLVVAACGSGGSATPTNDASATSTTMATGVDLSKATFVDDTGQKKVEVDAVDNNFSDQYVKIKAGTTVEFKNTGHNEHNVIPVVKGSFKKAETSQFEPGTSYTVVFAKPGDYPYYCTLHGTPMKGMTGAIRVVA
jgi:plastocyanin